MENLGIDYESLFHTLPGIYIVLKNDAPLYTILDMNRMQAKKRKIDSARFIGKPFHTAFPVANNTESQESTLQFEAAFDRCVTSGKAEHLDVLRYDVAYKRKDMDRHLWDSWLYPIEKNGQIIGVILASEEVTKRYDADDYTKQRLRHLEHLVEINQTKDEFISITSHQLRTPATGVKQYLSMLRDGMFGELTDMQADILERAYESNERQLRIVTDMLKVAQVDAGKVVLHKELNDVNRLVNYMIKDTAGVFEKRGQTVTFLPTEGELVAYIDGEIVRMVVENILDNASKYTPEGGNVHVAIIDDDTSFTISVADEGVGISTDQQEQLFKKFVRIDNPLSTKVGGTGLGLYWAKRSIDLHGGDVTHRHNAPTGSIFEIKLPKE